MKQKLPGCLFALLLIFGVWIVWLRVCLPVSFMHHELIDKRSWRGITYSSLCVCYLTDRDTFIDSH